MRRYDEHVEVRSGRIGEGIAGLDAEQLAVWPEGPNQFVWRNRLWRVLGVQARWVESGPWWDSSAVRAARGDDVLEAPGVGPAGFGAVGSASPSLAEPTPGVLADVLLDAGFGGAGRDGDQAVDGDQVVDGDDLLCEQEVWRVEAANGRDGGRGVYELAHAWADGSWRLRAVLD